MLVEAAGVFRGRIAFDSPAANAPASIVIERAGPQVWSSPAWQATAMAWMVALRAPFASWCELVALNFLRKQIDASEDDPEVLRARDSYLHVFSDLVSHARLVETMELACRVGKIARALVWLRALGTIEPDQSDDDGSAPWEWMKSLL